MSVVELTPRGRGGVSVLEVRGAAARAALADLTHRWPGEPALGNAPRLVRLGSPELGLEEEALVLARADGALEVHIHGSPPLVAALIAELTQGADEGGTELPQVPSASLEARAAELLAGVETLAGARTLLDQSEGALRAGLQAWREAAPAARAALAAELVEAGRVTQALVEPLRIVLAGPVNMGKSTLFNLLVGAERVVVSGEAGTTRDVIEEHAVLGAYPVRIVDTAGMRAAEGPLRAVEAAGQVLGEVAAAGADWVVWLDRSAALSSSSFPGLRPIVSRFVGRGDEPGDRCSEGTPRLAPLSDPERALDDVRTAFRTAFELPAAPWLPGRAAPFDAAGRALAAALLTAPDAPATGAALDRALS